MQSSFEFFQVVQSFFEFFRVMQSFCYFCGVVKTLKQAKSLQIFYK